MSIVTYPKYRGVLPVTAATYNLQSNLLFYGLSYDWSMGSEAPMAVSLYQYPRSQVINNDIYLCLF